MEQAARDHPNPALSVDVGPLLDQAEDETLFLQQFCRQFGYFPDFLNVKRLGSYLDAVVPGSSKAAHKDAAATIASVLATATRALVRMEADWLEAAGGDEEAYPVPLIVVVGFTGENRASKQGDVLFQSMVRWSAVVAENKLARVVFVGDSTWAKLAMLDALSDRADLLEERALDDAPPSLVRTWLSERILGGDVPPQELDDALRVVGGRFADLQVLTRHLRHGRAPQAAVEEMLGVAVSATRAHLERGGKEQTQLCRAVKLLSNAETPQVSYEVFLWEVSRGDETAVRGLVTKGFVTVQGRGTQTATVCAVSPLYREAFRRLVRHGTSHLYELANVKEHIAREQARCDELEQELCRLQAVDDVERETGRALMDPNSTLAARKVFLLDQIQEQHEKLERWHSERRHLARIISKK